MGVKVPFLGVFLVTHPACVLPEDVIHVACYHEGRALDKVQGIMSPSDLSVDYVYSQALKLVEYINSESPSEQVVTSQREARPNAMASDYSAMRKERNRAGG